MQSHEQFCRLLQPFHARLLPYQRDWLAADSRLKIALWARQTGKDYTCALEAVVRATSLPNSTWMIVAASERQALESLEKAKAWCNDVKCEPDSESVEKETPQAKLQRAMITWPNGSRLMAVPSKPGTLRGFSANVILTEFAFHDDPDAIWRAVYPSITNPLKGGPKMLRIISTPNGLANKFARLWESGEDFFKSRVTIHDAIAGGLHLNAEELKRGLNDDQAWAQEYLCEFMDGSSVLLPYDLIASCESEEASECATPESLSGLEGRLFAGIDFGRKNDLTVCWILHRTREALVTREILVLRSLPTPEQVRILSPRVKLCHKVCVDFTGPGVGLGDYLVKEFHEWNPEGRRHGKIDLCHFTLGLKNELFPRLRAAFEAREVLIPISTEAREDLHAIHRVVTAGGQIGYRAVSAPDGHSDRCTALALALRAAQNTPFTPNTETRATVKPRIIPGLFQARQRVLR